MRSKTQTELLITEWKIYNLGLFFGENKDENENCMVYVNNSKAFKNCQGDLREHLFKACNNATPKLLNNN